MCIPYPTLKEVWMMAVISKNLPIGFNALPERAELPKFKNLTKTISNNLHLNGLIDPDYQSHIVARSIVVAALIAGVVALAILALEAPLISTLIQSVSWVNIGIGIGSFALLATGAGFVIHRVCHLKDKLIKVPGSFHGDSGWHSALLERGDHRYRALIDTSTLEEGSGKAFVYAYKSIDEHYNVSFVVTIVTPIHLLSSLAYSVARLAVVPLYILGCLCIEKVKGSPLFSENSAHSIERAFTLWDIPDQMGKTGLRILKAPFYATALIFAALYSFIDPLNGRKLGAGIERDWNEGLSRAQGFGIATGPQPLFKPEGGGNPSDLGQNVVYLAACWQPIAMASYKKGLIERVVSLTRAVNSSKGHEYILYTHEDCRQKHNALVAQMSESE